MDELADDESVDVVVEGREWIDTIKRAVHPKALQVFNDLCDEVEQLRATIARVQEAVGDDKELKSPILCYAYPEVSPPLQKLICNAAYCRTCDTVIESKFRHDWVGCKCPRGSDTFIYVDGGLDYARSGAGNKASYLSLCEYGDLLR